MVSHCSQQLCSFHRPSILHHWHCSVCSAFSFCTLASVLSLVLFLPVPSIVSFDSSPKARFHSWCSPLMLLGRSSIHSASPFSTLGRSFPVVVVYISSKAMFLFVQCCSCTLPIFTKPYFMYKTLFRSPQMSQISFSFRACYFLSFTASWFHYTIGFRCKKHSYESSLWSHNVNCIIHLYSSLLFYIIFINPTFALFLYHFMFSKLNYVFHVNVG